MTTEHIFGVLATAITLAYTCIGLPAQVRKNAREKSTGGLSKFMYVLSFLTFSIWVVYGLVKAPRDWFIIASNFPGAVFVASILYQFRAYRDGK